MNLEVDVDAFILNPKKKKEKKKHPTVRSKTSNVYLV